MKSLAVTGSLGLLAFAGLASASTIAYDQTLTNTTPGYYNGTGNSSDHFTTLTDGNLQLALSIVDRYNGPALTPTGNNYDYNDNPNIDPTKNWGFYYSIDTRNGGGTGLIGDNSYLLIFTDETLGETLSYDPLVSDDSYYDGTGVHGGSSNSTGVAANDPNYAALNDAAQANYYGIQNAGWAGWFPVSFTFNPNDVFSITLQSTAKTQGAATDALTVTVNAQATPEPGTIVTMLGSLGALGLFIRRRKA
ncbi:MAG TPA: PEP-CTERM sorting domain-containing protein [Bryobacteraceae bacterium]|nr:PEP-CTERM sorting domain-containing protein [Bryobacteraceae bacterium]